MRLTTDTVLDLTPFLEGQERSNSDTPSLLPHEPWGS